MAFSTRLVICAVERSLTGHHLVKHGTKREDVGTMVRFFAIELFRRHVGKGACECAPCRHSLPRRGRDSRRRIDLVTCPIHTLQLGQPEIEQFGARLGEHDVAGLQVTMHDARAMRGHERISDGDRVLEGLVHRYRSASQPLRQRLPFEQFHDQKVDPVGVTKVVKHANVRMVQRCNGLRLALEPFSPRGVLSQVVRKDLDGNRPVQTGVYGAVHIAHATRRKLSLEAIGAELPSRQ